MSIYSKLVCALVFSALLILPGCGSKPAEKKSPENELKDVMSEAIAFVENDDVKGLFEKFTPPEDLKRLKSAGELDGAVDRFNIFGKQFVEAMKEARSVSPVFNDDTTRATYEIIDVPVPGQKVVFRKIDGKWYFSD